MRNRRWSRIVLLVILSITLISLWEFVISNSDNMQLINTKIEEVTGWNPKIKSIVETMLPRPSRILNTLIKTPINGRGGPEFFWRHTKITLYGAALGFVVGNLLAIITATIFLYVKPLERALMPIALALRSIPLVAISPLLLRIRFGLSDLEIVQTHPILNSIFGTELFMKVIIVVIIVFFPTLVNVDRGLNSVSQPALELMHTLRASRWQIYWKLRVPTALPLTFAALKVATSSAVLGVVVAEWLSSSQGLGYVIYRSYGESQVARMMMAMILACIISIITFASVGIIQKWSIPWHRSATPMQGVAKTG